MNEGEIIGRKEGWMGELRRKVGGVGRTKGWKIAWMDG